MPKLKRTAMALIGVALLSGCGDMQIARPESPEVSPPVKVAVGDEESAEFLSGYTERLDATLEGNMDDLEQLQTGPLLERTRAEVTIADAADETLQALTYADVVAGAPQLGQYPLWFLASATPTGDEESSQLLLVTRETAGDEWKVAQTVFSPRDQAPSFLGGEEGQVAEADAAFKEQTAPALDSVAAFLAEGTEPEGFTLSGDAFQDYRTYLGDLGEGDGGLEDVRSTCEPYSEMDLTSMALATETGAVALGEVRCTLTGSVPEGYSVNLAEALEAVMTSEGDGTEISVETSHPVMISQLEDGTIQVVNDDWNLLSASTRNP